MKVYGIGPIRRRKPASRQDALEYPRQIANCKIIFMAVSRPYIYILGNFLVLCIVGLLETMPCWLVI